MNVDSRLYGFITVDVDELDLEKPREIEELVDERLANLRAELLGRIPQEIVNYKTTGTISTDWEGSA